MRRLAPLFAALIASAASGATTAAPSPPAPVASAVSAVSAQPAEEASSDAAPVGLLPFRSHLATLASDAYEGFRTSFRARYEGDSNG